MLGFVAVKSKDFSWSFVDNEAFLRNLAAILDVLLEAIVVCLKFLHSLDSLAFSLYILLEMVVSLRHWSFLDW